MIVENLRGKLLSKMRILKLLNTISQLNLKNDVLKCYKIEETVPTLIIKTEIGFYALIISE